MPIIATAGSDSRTFTPAPAGVHQAVCVDVIDKGMIESQFVDERTGAKKVQHKIDIAWQLANERRDDNKRFIVYKRYTLSLNEKATLRKDRESWRGRAFTRDEERGFDVESVIGVNGLVNVQHNTKGDKTYANVASVMPLMKGMPKASAEDYQRAVEGEPSSLAHDPAPEVTEDDIPF